MDNIFFHISFAFLYDCDSLLAVLEFLMKYDNVSAFDIETRARSVASRSNPVSNENGKFVYVMSAVKSQLKLYKQTDLN